jgi:hypothetical protein
LLAICLSLLSSTACGLSDLVGDGKCKKCVVSDDCKNDLVCICVENQQTGELFCSACAPEEYDRLEGSKKDETYTCENVD